MAWAGLSAFNANALAAASISQLRIINADSLIVVRNLSTTDTLSLSTLPARFTLEALASGTVGSLEFKINGSRTRVETWKPFIMTGDNQTTLSVPASNATSWNPTPGVYKIQVIPWSGVSASGTAGTARTFNLTVTGAQTSSLGVSGLVGDSSNLARVQAYMADLYPGNAQKGMRLWYTIGEPNWTEAIARLKAFNQMPVSTQNDRRNKYLAFASEGRANIDAYPRMIGPNTRANVLSAGYYKAHNYRTVMTFALPVNPSAAMRPTRAQAHDYFAELLKMKLSYSETGINIDFDLKRDIDAWQIQNEYDLAEYWPQTSDAASNLVENLLRGAFEVLKPANKTVIGPSSIPGGSYQSSGQTVWHLDRQKNLVSAGMLNYVDAVDIHSYIESSAQQEKFLTQVKAVYAGKPLYVTEWNCQRYAFQNSNGQLDKSAWASCLRDSVVVLRKKSVESYLYLLHANFERTHGPGGLLLDCAFTVGRTANEPMDCRNAGRDYQGDSYDFYQAFKDGLKKTN